MQENLGITLIKVALLVMILFVLTLNTCQMTSIEERYNEVRTELRDVNANLNKLEDRVNKFSDNPVNVNLNFGENKGIAPDSVDQSTNSDSANDKSDQNIDTNDESLENPLSLISLQDFAYYNQDVLTDMVDTLKKQNPELYSDFEYYGFATPLEEYPELLDMLRAEVKNIMKEPNSAESYIKADNRNELIAPDANFESSIVFSYHDNPKTFNPLVSNEAQFSVLKTRINDTLCKRDPADPDNYIGLLAKKVTITDDYKCYTFWLKPGVKWSKPVFSSNDPRFDWIRNADVEVTAEDVAFTLDMILNPSVNCNHIRNYYLNPDGSQAAKIRIINRYLFQTIWTKKTYQSKAFSLEMYPWPKHIYGRDEFGNPYDEASLGTMFNDHWLAKQNNIIGCGAYMLTRFKKSDDMQLIRNENYHSVKPPIRKITCKILTDGNLVYRTFKEKKLDLMTIPSDIWKRDVRDNEDKNSVFKNGDIQLEKFTRNAYYYIGWNQERAFFSDAKVRRAMTHAFNRKDIVKNVYYDMAEVVTGNFWNESPEYDHSIKPFDYNLQKAAELLDEAGWTIKEGNTIRSKVIDGKEVFLSFVLSLSEGNDQTLTSTKIFSEDLKKIGVDMTPKPMQWSVLEKLVGEGDFDACVMGWYLGYESDPWQLWHSSEADKPLSSNHVKFRNKEADKIIEELRVTFDRDKRIELCHKFHKLIHEEQPYTFFISLKSIGAHWKWVKNLKFGALFPRSYLFPVHTVTH